MNTLDDMSGPGSRGHSSVEHGIVEAARLMSMEDALLLSLVYDSDTNPEYLHACDIVGAGLKSIGQLPARSWFDAIFEGCEWLGSTKALAPIADAIVACRARGLVADKYTDILMRPWLTLQSVP